MADANEKVLISIEIEKPEGEAQIDALTQKITGLQKATAELKKENNELIKQGKENSDQYIENTRQIEVNKQKINEATASRKGLVQTILAEDNSIKALSIRNKELIKERDLLSTSTEEGRTKIAKINQELNKNNETIKQNVSALEKQKINIGNYKSALDGIVPGLGGFIGGLQGATAAAKAFIATPIGLILAAVAAALALVTSYFKNVSDGADFLEDSFTAISTVLDVVIDRLGRFVGGIVAIINGNFSEGLDKIANSFAGIGDEIEREIGLALELNQAMRDLEDQEIRSAVAAAETENQIRRLLLQSRNRSASEAERIKLLEQATALEKGLNAEEIKNRTEALRIANQQAALRLNLTKTQAETEIEFGKRVLEAFTADGAVQADDLRDRVKDTILAITNAEGQSIAILEKIQNQRDALADSAEAKRQKAADEEAKRISELEKAAREAADKAAEAELDRQERIRTAENETQLLRIQQQAEYAKSIEDRVAKEIEFETLKALQLLDNAQLTEEERQLILEQSQAKINQIYAKGQAERAKIDKKEADEKKKLNDDVERQKQQGLSASASAAIGFSRAVFGNTKAGAIAEATINTIAGVVRALKDYVFPYSLIVGALVGATGAAQIGKIANTNFSLGGLIKRFAGGGMLRNIAATGGVLRGPLHRDGGIPFTVRGHAGFEAEGDEAIINRRSTRMYRPLLSAINQAGGGVPFERGGVTRFQTGAIIGSQTSIASQQAESTTNIRNTVQSLMESFPPIVTVVTDINERQAEVAENTIKANII